MKFETTRFGQVEVDPESIVIFPDGLFGFPDCTRFTIIDEERSYPFRMLQSLEKPSLAFVIVDPLVVWPDYHFTVTREDLKSVKAENPDDLLVYAIVTMAPKVEDITVNLQGPLVMNPGRKLGHQYVLVNEGYTTREKLLIKKAQKQEVGQRPAHTEGMSRKKAI